MGLAKLLKAGKLSSCSDSLQAPRGFVVTQFGKDQMTELSYVQRGMADDLWVLLMEQRPACRCRAVSVSSMGLTIEEVFLIQARLFQRFFLLFGQRVIAVPEEAEVV
jgi:hypothetical protein